MKQHNKSTLRCHTKAKIELELERYITRIYCLFYFKKSFETISQVFTEIK